jgi:ABC-type dipeptide/oligopeptide/nickel transport system permease subunit
MPETGPRRKGQSLWNDAWRRLRKNRFAMAGLVVTVLVTLTALAAPWITPMDSDYGQPWLRFARPPGFEHPAVLSEIRFDKGRGPAIPERIPDRIHDYLAEDGTLRYSFTEVAEREYRVRMRRGKVTKIQRREGAVTVDRLAIQGELALARLLDREGQPTGPELRNFELVRKEKLPEVLADYAKERILVLRVREPETTEPESAEIVLRDGSVAELRRNGKDIESLRTEGRFVHEVSKDGEVQTFRHVLGTDDLGRDVWARVVYGGQISLMVGAVATLVSILIGVVYGAVAGYQSSVPMTQWHAVFFVVGLALASSVMAANPILNHVFEPHRPFGFSFGYLFPAALASFLLVLWAGGRLARRLPARIPLTTQGEFMMRIVDVLYALPFMFLVILLMISYGKDLVTLFVALGAVQWLMMARIVRGQVLSLKEKEFVEAARMCGSSDFGIIFRHLIPNTLGVVVVYATLTVPAVILQESFLSFIGLSVEFQGRTLDSWGSLVDQGRQALTASGGKWWILVFPSLAMAITLFSLNFLGDGLRDALDPQLKGKS